MATPHIVSGTAEEIMMELYGAGLITNFSATKSVLEILQGLDPGEIILVDELPETGTEKRIYQVRSTGKYYLYFRARWVDLAVSGGSALWGQIEGDINKQIDLQTVLSGKAGKPSGSAFGNFLTADNDGVISDSGYSHNNFLGQYTVIPTASVLFVNKIIQYVGTSGIYICGFFYRCQATSGGLYEWVSIDVQQAAEAVWGQIVGDISEQTDLQELIGEKSKKFISLSYSSLKNLRDGGQLLPAMYYRINDFVTTVNGTDIASAGHAFDLIVYATSASTLSTKAIAVRHENDTYFASCDMSRWDIHYSIDNDTNKYPWASESGKGIIYYMKDEWENEAPYDFKNILFYRKWNSTRSSWCDKGTSTDLPAYTFSSQATSTSTSVYDATMAPADSVHNNVIKCYYDDDNDLKKIHLNNIVFFGTRCYSNSFGTDCHNCTFGHACNNNHFGDNCNNILMNNNCCSNVFKGNNVDILFGKSAESVGNGFFYNTINMGAEHIVLYNDGIGRVMYYNIMTPVSGSVSSKTLFNVTRENAYAVNISKNSEGTIIKYCETDLMNNILP